MTLTFSAERSTRPPAVRAAHAAFDISFADEDDVLRYWSGRTYRTCDRTSSARTCAPVTRPLAGDPRAILQAFRRRARHRRRLHENGGRSPTPVTRRARRQRRYRGILESTTT